MVPGSQLPEATLVHPLRPLEKIALRTLCQARRSVMVTGSCSPSRSLSFAIQSLLLLCMVCGVWCVCVFSDSFDVTNVLWQVRIADLHSASGCPTCIDSWRPMDSTCTSSSSTLPRRMLRYVCMSLGSFVFLCLSSHPLQDEWPVGRDISKVPQSRCTADRCSNAVMTLNEFNIRIPTYAAAMAEVRTSLCVCDKV